MFLNTKIVYISLNCCIYHIITRKQMLWHVRRLYMDELVQENDNNQILIPWCQ